MWGESTSIREVAEASVSSICGGAGARLSRGLVCNYGNCICGVGKQDMIEG